VFSPSVIVRRCLLLSLLAVLALPAASAMAQGDGLVPRSLYKTGNSGRYLMGGTWLFRADPGGNASFAGDTGTVGWTPVTVPNAWNATDQSDGSFAGGIGWYRKDFRLPSNARRLSWVVRFESVNYRSRIYLNGRLVGKNTGAYLPFEVRLPAGVLKRGQVNRLAVRIDSRRFPTDFPPSGLSAIGAPTGGGTTAGSCARSTCARSTASTSTPSRSRRRCRAAPATRPSPTGPRSATTATAPSA
jgi:Glycosyl hydrolases family 2, sugar binding domain